MLAIPENRQPQSANAGTHRTVIVELTDGDGVNAIGEAASSLYGESADGLLNFSGSLMKKDFVQRYSSGMAFLSPSREFPWPPNAC